MYVVCRDGTFWESYYLDTRLFVAQTLWVADHLGCRPYETDVLSPDVWTRDVVSDYREESKWVLKMLGWYEVRGGICVRGVAWRVVRVGGREVGRVGRW